MSIEIQKIKTHTDSDINLADALNIASRDTLPNASELESIEKNCVAISSKFLNWVYNDGKYKDHIMSDEKGVSHYHIAILAGEVVPMSDELHQYPFEPGSIVIAQPEGVASLIINYNAGSAQYQFYLPRDESGVYPKLDPNKSTILVQDPNGFFQPKIISTSESNTILTEVAKMISNAQ